MGHMYDVRLYGHMYGHMGICMYDVRGIYLVVYKSTHCTQTFSCFYSSLVTLVTKLALLGKLH